VKRRIPVATIASCYALGAFAIATLSGLAAGRPASEILSDALMALLVCWLVGLIVGRASEVVAREHVERFEAENEIPGVGLPAVDGEAALEPHASSGV